MQVAYKMHRACYPARKTIIMELEPGHTGSTQHTHSLISPISFVLGALRLLRMYTRILLFSWHGDNFLYSRTGHVVSREFNV